MYDAKRSQRARSIQPKFRRVRPGKEDHLKRWTCLFETFPVGPNRSIEVWTEISGHFGWMIGPKRSYPVCLFLFSTLNVLEPRQKDLYGKMHFSIYVSSSRLYSFADCLVVMERRKLKPTWGVNEEPFAFEYIGTSIRESPLGPRKVSPEWRLGWDLLIINQQRKYL